MVYTSSSIFVLCVAAIGLKHHMYNGYDQFNNYQCAVFSVSCTTYILSYRHWRVAMRVTCCYTPIKFGWVLQHSLDLQIFISCLFIYELRHIGFYDWYKSKKFKHCSFFKTKFEIGFFVLVNFQFNFQCMVFRSQLL